MEGNDRANKAWWSNPWLIALGLVAVIALWMLSGQFGAEPDAADPLAASRGGLAQVQVQEHEAQEVTRYAEVYGRTAPARSVTLAVETDGRVTRVPVRRGSLVRRGQVLVELDERDREAQRAQARAKVKKYETEYAAQRALFEEGGYVSETDLAATEADLESARAELAAAELEVKNRLVKAPFDGVLEERTVEIGDFVRTGDDVATVADTFTLIVEASVPERNAGAVIAGGDAEAELATGEVVSGSLRYVAPVADEATRTFQVELEVANKDGILPAGVTAQLRIPTGTAKAHYLPPSLLSLDDSGTLGIKIVDENNQVVFYPTEVVASDSAGVWVTGLPDIADIIMVGQGFVRAGEQVDPLLMQADTALARDGTE